MPAALRAGVVSAPSSSTAQQVERCLAPHLGAHTARNAVRLCAERALGRRPHEIDKEDGPALVHALRPMLCTLLGTASAEHLLADILAQVRT
jgi:hypothetical protein